MISSHKSTGPVCEDNIHRDQSGKQHYSKEELETALSRKHRQHLAASLGRVNIQIAPLEKQMQRLATMLQEQKQKNSERDTTKEIVVPLRTSYEEGDRNIRTETERQEGARLQEAQALSNVEKDNEKILGTWL